MITKIKKGYEFDKLIAHPNKTLANYHYVVKRIKNEYSAETKYAIIVSKKVGKAHDRHYVRRRIKEVVRNNASTFKEGYIYLIIARKNLLTSDYSEYLKSFNHIINLSNKEKK